MTKNNHAALLSQLYDAAQWALTPELKSRNDASYEELARALERAKPLVDPAG